MQEIPTFQGDSADFFQEIELGAQLFTIRITWNSRSEYYYMILTNELGEEIGSTKMVISYPLFSIHKGIFDFDGDFFIFRKDITAGDEVTYENLGVSWGVFYLTQDEVDEWVAENGLG